MDICLMLFPDREKTLSRILFFLKILAIYLLAIELNLFYLFGYSPSFSELRKPDISIASEIYTNDGKLLGRYFNENRTPVSFDQLPPVLIDALVATEDTRFYKHQGIDILSVFTSAWSTFRGDKRGASTITQQLAKNLFKTRKKQSQGLLRYIPGLRTVIYKSKEWITAFKLEVIHSKEDILAMYLNTVSFGNNAFGIKTAARKYFNKEPRDLNTQESALLVGMLKATSLYNPISHPDKAAERRNVVLSQMLKYEKLEQGEYDSLSKLPLKLRITDENLLDPQDSYIPAAAAGFLKEWCRQNNLDIYSDGLKIYTSIDSKLQTYAEQAMNQHMRSLQKRFYFHWENKNPWILENGEEIPGFIENLAKRLPVYKSLNKRFKAHPDSVRIALNKPKRMKVFTWKGDQDTTFSTMDSLRYYVKILRSGMITIDPFSGHIKTWVGGINFNYFKYDHVKQAKRQPGSTFKPFVYLAAIDMGYSPCDQFVDQPVYIPYEENGEKKTWAPRNSDGVFTWNSMSLRWAMAKSCNSVTAQLTDSIGPENVVKYARMLGISSKLEAVPSIGLGPHDVSLYDMVRAYGVFLNKGILTEPLLVTKITDRDGNILAEFTPTRKRVLSEETAFLMIHMFKGGIEEPGGTSQALWEYDLFDNKNEIGGKTGTSSNHSDGWYIGLTKDLVTGVWVGAEERSVHFRTSSLGEGSKTALPIYGKFMEKVYKDPSTGITQGKFPKPEKKIERKYYCPTKVIRVLPDSLSGDSLQPLPVITDSISTAL